MDFNRGREVASWMEVGDRAKSLASLLEQGFTQHKKAMKTAAFQLLH